MSAYDLPKHGCPDGLHTWNRIHRRLDEPWQQCACGQKTWAHEMPDVRLHVWIKDTEHGWMEALLFDPEDIAAHEELGYRRYALAVSSSAVSAPEKERT